MLVLLLLTLFAPSAATAPPDAAALLALKSSTDPQDCLHFNLSTSPCFWTGIRCSETGRVIRLVAESSNLTGTLPSSSFHRIDQLRVLSLSFNSLSGPIPDLSPLLNLKSLFLSHNRLSGPFPLFLLSLRRLRTLDLAHNLLSGPIPPSLAVAPARIYALRLESNRFVGAIPPLNQSSLRFFNVCNNNLSGPVPVTAALSGFGGSAFGGNPGLCGEAVRRECRAHLVFFHGPDRIAPSPAGEAQLRGLISSASPPPPPPTRKMRRRRRAVVVVLSLAAAFLVIGIVGILLALKQRRIRNGKRLNPESDAAATGAVESMDVAYGGRNGCEIDDGNDELAAAVNVSEDKVKKLGKSGSLMFCAGEAPVYTLEQLMRASAEMLGRGSIGSTYKAVLDNRLIVCVKRLDASKLAATGKETFERHMDVVGRLRHPNLVPLRAYFQAKEERLLVYDYQPNGSLYSLIHGSRSTRAKPLHWTSCLKIAEDVAQGLAYIHQASRLVHGNVKSSNVLLGSEFEACLTDNCLSFLVEPSDGEDDSGYRAPETRKSNRRLTPRSDIYAFGILLLELLTGKPPLQHQILIATDLPVWVHSVREDEAGTEDERLGLIIDIATACVRSSPESRPTTWQVLKMIQEVKEEDTGDNDDDSASIS